MFDLDNPNFDEATQATMNDLTASNLALHGQLIVAKDKVLALEREVKMLKAQSAQWQDEYNKAIDLLNDHKFQNTNII